MRKLSVVALLCATCILASCEDEGPAADADTGIELDVSDENEEVIDEPQLSCEEIAALDAERPIPSTCEGREDWCSRRYDEITWPATHNAMSNAEEGWILPNQNLPIETQLEDGIRAMLLDVHYEFGEVKLCHSFCFAGERNFADAMIAVREFLRDNPDVILTLHFQDELETERIVGVLEETCLSDMVYTHPSVETPFPTLGEMVAANTRLVLTSERSGPPPAWYHYAWSLMRDTPYTFSSIEEFSCELNRGPDDAPLQLINHWVQDPATSPDLAAEANTREVLGGRLETCYEEIGQRPNFVAVDFYDIGDLFEVVEAWNEADELPPSLGLQ